MVEIFGIEKLDNHQILSISIVSDGINQKLYPSHGKLIIDIF